LIFVFPKGGLPFALFFAKGGPLRVRRSHFSDTPGAAAFGFKAAGFDFLAGETRAQAERFPNTA
jgi:hypothetical protein